MSFKEKIKAWYNITISELSELWKLGKNYKERYNTLVARMMAIKKIIKEENI